MISSQIPLVNQLLLNRFTRSTNKDKNVGIDDSRISTSASGDDETVWEGRLIWTFYLKMQHFGKTS